jgi:hypothetical protein
MSSFSKSSAGTTCARAAPGEDFKRCCLQSGRYDGAQRAYYFQAKGLTLVALVKLPELSLAASDPRQGSDVRSLQPLPPCERHRRPWQIGYRCRDNDQRRATGHDAGQGLL